MDQKLAALPRPIEPSCAFDVSSTSQLSNEFVSDGPLECVLFCGENTSARQIKCRRIELEETDTKSPTQFVFGSLQQVLRQDSGLFVIAE